MGMDAINKILYGIKFKNQEEFLKYFGLVQKDLDDIDEYGNQLYDVIGDLFHQPWEYDEAFIIGWSIFDGDWENGFEEIGYLFNNIEEEKAKAIKEIKEGLLWSCEEDTEIIKKVRQKIEKEIRYEEFKLYNYCNYW